MRTSHALLLLIPLTLGSSLLIGCGYGGPIRPQDFQPASSFPVAQLTPPQPLSKFVGRWIGTWQTPTNLGSTLGPLQTGNLTLDIDAKGKITGTLHNATANQDGTVDAQFDTSGDTTTGIVRGTVVQGSQSNPANGNYGFDAQGHLGGILLLPGLPSDPSHVNVGAVFTLTRQ